MKKRKSENADDTKQNAEDTKQIADGTKQIADDTKQIADDTKQNKRGQEVYAVPCGSQFCKSGLGILRKGEVIP
ncbi:hypothetical protein T11_18611 [Trichinella zimbabwensis]|uniref:Uncharacterized protein n=1 Tax=Trichinella zimbabwensis TaxID=268475 RepID=A0A0V1HX71_9BILA|nr:hypothetical protein T11_18611 [Trichinella zimbabwensis]